jgi:hypothetical protein
MVVDRVGALATLYAAGAIAYVGGGFGTVGLHSVLEPAACARPVLFGPAWHASREAGLLLARRAAVVISPKFCDWLDLDAMSTQAGASPLAAIWLALLRNPEHARAAGRRGLECVEAGVGAAARNAGLVERLMSPAAPLPPDDDAFVCHRSRQRPRPRVMPVTSTSNHRLLVRIFRFPPPAPPRPDGWTALPQICLREGDEPEEPVHCVPRHLERLPGRQVAGRRRHVTGTPSVVESKTWGARGGAQQQQGDKRAEAPPSRAHLEAEADAQDRGG